jgi:hypothetical protein
LQIYGGIGGVLRLQLEVTEMQRSILDVEQQPVLVKLRQAYRRDGTSVNEYALAVAADCQAACPFQEFLVVRVRFGAYSPNVCVNAFSSSAARNAPLFFRQTLPS